MDYYKTSLEADPPGPTNGQDKVVRGGSWFGDFPSSLRCSNRDRLVPVFRISSVGFRCVREVFP